MREHTEKKIIKADKEVRDLRSKYEKELKELIEKRNKLIKDKKEEIEARENRGLIDRMMDTKNKDIGELDAQIELLNKQEKTIVKFLDSPISKDKEIEVTRVENVRVDTGHKTYNFKVDEWLDRTDSPELLKNHRNLPFLDLQIQCKTTISKSAKKTLEAGRERIIQMNHTDIPHSMSISERDVLHETNSSIGIEGGVAS